MPTAPRISMRGSASRSTRWSFEGQAQEAVVDPVEALLLEALAPEGLDDLVAGEGLLQHDVQLADLLLRSLGDLVELAPERAEEHAHRGKMTTAMRASTHSRMNITVRRATMVAT